MLSVTRLNFVKRLKDKTFRRKFFRSSAQQEVAQQIRDLRMKQGKRQVDLARAAHMKQSAVSRIEQASYSRWNFATLLRVADSLDARVRVIFQPADEVIKEYERSEEERAILQKQFEEHAHGLPFAELVGQLALPQSGIGSAVRRFTISTKAVSAARTQGQPESAARIQGIAPIS